MTRRPHCSTPATYVTHFWLLVERRDPDQCWPWLGYTQHGYGKYFDGSRMRNAHELALEWTTGETRAATLDTCHSCHTPSCCNPAHLRFDTRLSNVADMYRAGRQPVMAKKLTDAEVVVIRERAQAGATGRALATAYAVSESLVTEIIRGNRRASAGGPLRTTHGNRKAST